MTNINDFNSNHISYRFFGDKFSSLEPSANFIIESSSNNIEFKTNKKVLFNNNTIFNYGLVMKDKEISGIEIISTKTLNVGTIFLSDLRNVNIIDNIEDNFSLNYGYIRGTSIGYNPDLSGDKGKDSGRSFAYFTYINVSGGDSSFNDSVYIKNNLQISEATNISGDLIVNGKSFLSINNNINEYLSNIGSSLASSNILTRDLSATNISISNDLYVDKTSIFNNLTLSGQVLNNVLKVPNMFIIDPSGYDNNSGTLIINGDLIVYGNRTVIQSNIIETSDVAISVATNLLNKLDLSLNNAGLDISNIASFKYDGTNWKLVGGDLFVKNKKITLDISLINTKNIIELSLNTLRSNFDLSYTLLKKNMDDSFNVIYTLNQIDNSFVLNSVLDSSLTNLTTYIDSSYVSKIQFEASFNALKSILDMSYIPKSSTLYPISILDISLNSLNSKLDLSYVLKTTFEGSYNSLKEQFETSFNKVSIISLDTSSITIETINTKHYSKKFSNMLWNQLGQDISNGLPNTNNNNKIAISNDGKVVAMSSSSHIGISKGRVYVYEISYNQTSYDFTPLGLSSEIIVGVSNDDQFGWDIALSSDGKVVAGSSIVNDSSGINSGQVRVFELSNNNVWKQKGNNINGSRINSESGYSISLAGNGNSIAIGAWKDNLNGTNAGAVRVYDFSASIDDWRQKGLTITGISGSYEGSSTALSSDGLTLASGSITGLYRAGTGGVITNNGSHTVHRFLGIGTFTFIPTFTGTVEVLIVGGGGGGGPSLGGGGGGGGVIYIPAASVTAGSSYSIEVGDGGPSGTNGQPSKAFTAIAAGGGTSSSGIGTTGGCGGGAPANGTTGGVSSGNSLGTNSGIIYGEGGGHLTSTASANSTRGAGGGGAGGQAVYTNPNTGDTGQHFAGSGGMGIANSILGTTYYWAGGGGGAAYDNPPGGWGGLGGGGGGSATYAGGIGIGGGYSLNDGKNGGVYTAGGAGGANTGGGGGGGSSGSHLGGKGGSGIVIIRYLQEGTGQVKTFTWSGTSWTNKGIIQGADMSFSYFGRTMKLSGNGNNIVIGAPRYSIFSKEYEPIYEYISTYKSWLQHKTDAITAGKSLAVILNAEQNDRANLTRPGNQWAWLGGVRRTVPTTAPLTLTGKTGTDWEWATGDAWSYERFSNGQPDGDAAPFGAIHFWTAAGEWNDLPSSYAYPAIYMTYYNRGVINIGQASVYGYQGGTTWSQIGQTITGISGGDEFGSNLSISNDGSTIVIGGRYSADNNSRCNLMVFKNYNNYWIQVGQTFNGLVNNSILAINHVLSGDGTTLFHNLGNQSSRVYGINKTLVLNTPITTISGNLVVLCNTSVNSLDISRNHIYTSSGYNYKVFDLSSTTASMKEYYSNVTSTKHLKLQITSNGFVYNRNNSYQGFSDSRFKENIIDSAPKLDDLLKVRIVNYNLKNSDTTKHIGVLAQELEEIFPDSVAELELSPKDIEDGKTIKYKTVNYSDLDLILIKSLQEQNAILNNITKRIEALEKNYIE